MILTNIKGKLKKAHRFEPKLKKKKNEQLKRWKVQERDKKLEKKTEEIDVGEPSC